MAHFLMKPNFSNGQTPFGFSSRIFFDFFRGFGFDLTFRFRFKGADCFPGSMSNSLYSKQEYLHQLLPCLEFTFALRKAFGVPVGVGRILNADEVMTYRYDPSTRTWHLWFVHLTVMTIDTFIYYQPEKRIALIIRKWNFIWGVNLVRKSQLFFFCIASGSTNINLESGLRNL